MFDRNKSGGYVTREQAESYVADLERKARNSFVSNEDAATYSRALNALEARVQELENLAAELRRGGRPVTPATTTAAPVQRDTTGVDYGAVAFGLFEIKRKLEGVVSSPQMREEYKGAVQYFADVFAKSDPEFDEWAFKRGAGLNSGENGSYTPNHP